MTQAEAKNLIAFLVRALWFIDASGYVKSLTLALHRITIGKSTLSADQFSRILTIADRTGLAHPVFQKKRGHYYRALYDAGSDFDQKDEARRKWESKVIGSCIDQMQHEWFDAMLVIDKMRTAGVPQQMIIEFTKFMRENSEYLVPEEVPTEFGEIRLISSVGT